MSVINSIQLNPFFTNQEVLLQYLYDTIIGDTHPELQQLMRENEKQIIDVTHKLLFSISTNNLVIMETPVPLEGQFNNWMEQVFTPAQVGREPIMIGEKQITLALVGRFTDGQHVGEISTFGCGYNVLAFLGILTLDEAQNNIQEMVNSNNNNGAGLPTEQIMQIIQTRMGIDYPITYFTLSWNDFNDNEILKFCVIGVYIAILFFTLSSLPVPNKSILVKQVRNITTGEGHTVIYTIHNGFLYMVDPQMGKARLMTLTSIQLLASQYQALQILVHSVPDIEMSAGNKRKIYR